MQALLTVAAVAGLLIMAAAGGLALHLRRRNRINPRLRCAAPLRWLWSVRGPARAHRRLRRALRGARGALTQGVACGLSADGLAECLDDLDRHAIAVDDQLVVASRFSRPIARSMLRGMRAEIVDIERLAARIAATVVSRASLSEQRPVDVRGGISERLDALELAHAEIAHLEARWAGPHTADTHSTGTHTVGTVSWKQPPATP